MTSVFQPIYLYQLFGLAVRSEIEFPEFTSMSENERHNAKYPWAELVHGEVPEHLVDSIPIANWIEVTKTECLFSVADKCRLIVSNGNRVTLDLFDGVPYEDIRPYLTTCGFATLAFQRQFIPLHVSAVETPRGVWLFTGPSGAGKSTLSVALSKVTGWPLLGDDLAVLEFPDPNQSPAGANCHFGVNKVKLWDDAAKSLGIDRDKLERDFFRPHKYHVMIPPGRGTIRCDEIAGIMSLSWGEETQEISLTAMSGSATFSTLMNGIYPPFMAPAYLDLARLRVILLGLSRGLKGVTAVRPKRDGSLDEAVAAIAAFIDQG
jgi:hypothetical protein